MTSLSSLEHPLIKHLVKLRVNRDYRHEHRTVLIAGIKPVKELPPDRIKTILTYDETFLPDVVNTQSIYIVNEALMKKASGMLSPEGLLAEVAMPEQADLNGKRHVLALDGINDPGNMGTLLRTALALGWDGVYVLENSCDPYNDKALRAARGATFRIPLRMGNWKELETLMESNVWAPWVADLEGTAPENVPKSERLLLILSNEAHGISAEAEALCSRVTIPMSGAMESLNVSVAGAILLYLLKGKS